jgi:Tfp pilus assembly protein PilX
MGWYRRFLGRASDETGAILVLALAFIAFVGLVSVALLKQTDTSFRITSQLRPMRSAQFAADGAVEGAINKLRQFRPDSSAPCVTDFYKVSPPLNGQDIVLSCSLSTAVGAITTPAIDVTFTAKCPNVASVSCPANATMITAVVRFAGNPPAVTTTVQKWSILR